MDTKKGGIQKASHMHRASRHGNQPSLRHAAHASDHAHGRAHAQTQPTLNRGRQRQIRSRDLDCCKLRRQAATCHSRHMGRNNGATCTEPAASRGRNIQVTATPECLEQCNNKCHRRRGVTSPQCPFLHVEERAVRLEWPRQAWAHKRPWCANSECWARAGSDGGR